MSGDCRSLDVDMLNSRISTAYIHFQSLYRLLNSVRGKIVSEADVQIEKNAMGPELYRHWLGHGNDRFVCFDEFAHPTQSAQVRSFSNEQASTLTSEDYSDDS
jgi:hypothetical protein